MRVSWNDPPALMKALDLGARAVIIPMIDTADEAARAANAMRYPPVGQRSFGPLRRRPPGVDAADQGVLCLPMIETAAGLRNVEQIAATPGVDGLFVGPIDLGLSLGSGLDPTMAGDAVLAGIDASVAAAQRNGIFVGTLAADAGHAAELVRRGVRFVTLSSDRIFLAVGAQATAESLRAVESGAC